MTAGELDLLAAIARYEGADRIEDDTPEAAMASRLEHLGMIKVVAFGVLGTTWKLSGLGLAELETAGRLPGLTHARRP